MEDSIDMRGNDLRFIASDSYRYLVSRLWRFAGVGILVLLATLGSANVASAQVTSVSATTLKGIKVLRGPDATQINSVAWVNLPGASASFTLAPGASYLFVTRFTAESVCYGDTGWCPVRVLMNGTEMGPSVAYDFAFDSTNGGAATSEGWQSHAVDRSLRYTNTSTKDLTVTAVLQYAVTDSTITFRLDDWQFTVEQFE